MVSFNYIDTRYENTYIANTVTHTHCLNEKKHFSPTCSNFLQLYNLIISFGKVFQPLSIFTQKVSGLTKRFLCIK